jgi:hypothetical protein
MRVQVPPPAPRFAPALVTRDDFSEPLDSLSEISSCSLSTYRDAREPLLKCRRHTIDLGFRQEVPRCFIAPPGDGLADLFCEWSATKVFSVDYRGETRIVSLLQG